MPRLPFVLPLALLPAWPLASPACELQASFVAPSTTRLSSAKPVYFALQFRNAGSRSACAANAVSLVRHADPPGSSAWTLGAVAPAQALPALAPGQQATVKLVEASPPASGVHVYRIVYQGAVVDSDAADHQPTLTLEFFRSATLGG
ncbi:MAG TPA: hypothetical protein PKO45_03500 [Rubrivivax sp.]|nr:hypothetical protein [Burkholderiales bacterium]HNT38166.1 hypothetical protein [Rubrivivax sp.]